MPDAKDAIAVGILVLTVAAFVPMLVDGTQGTKQDSTQIENKSSYDYTERLSVSVTDMSVSDSNATVEVSNSDTLTSSEKLLNVSQSKVYTIDGENVTVKLTDVYENPEGQFAEMTVTYPVTFGFGSASKTFFDNMEIIIVIVGAIIIFGVLGVVSKP